MNTKLSLLPLALALPMFAGCGEAVDAADAAADSAKDAAGDIADSAKGAMGDIAGNLGDLNIADMDMDAIKEQGAAAIKSITEQLGSLKSVADVDKIKGSMGPMIEKLVAMKDKFGASLPGTDALKTAVDGLKLKFLGNADMLNALEPIMEKLKGLTG